MLIDVRARKGVIIATGGFEWDTVMSREFLRGPMTHPAGMPTNTGDGQRMAMQIGASMGNMREAWWVPVIQVPGAELYGAQRPSLCLNERTNPRSLMVNRTGRRFCNEATNYNALGGAFHQFDPVAFDYVNLPAWLIFDEEFRRRYPVAGTPAGGEVPSWFVSASTPQELGAELGIDGDTLAATVARFNEFAVNGEDPDFHRGRSVYDGFNGDQRYEGPFMTLGPLDTGPFHAVQIHSGSLGTKGGPRTDTEGRVLDHHGKVIEGLFAAGNAMAVVTGMVAPSPARSATVHQARFASMSQNAQSSALRAAPGGSARCNVSRFRPETIASFSPFRAAATLSALSPNRSSGTHSPRPRESPSAISAMMVSAVVLSPRAVATGRASAQERRVTVSR